MRRIGAEKKGRGIAASPLSLFSQAENQFLEELVDEIFQHFLASTGVRRGFAFLQHIAF
jgi:hypothetical protein